MAKRIRRRSGSLPLATVDKFDGGLNTFMSKAKIADNESPSLRNIEFVENGIPAKRRGTTLFGGEEGDSTVGIGSLKTSGGDSYFLRVVGDALLSKNGDIWDEIEDEVFTEGMLANFVQARDAVYIHNGVDNMQKFDGSALTEPTTGVVAEFGIYYNGRHIVSGNPSNPTRVYLSSSKSSENFTGKTGTSTGSNTSTTLKDTGQSWDTDEFAGLNIVVTAGTGAGQHRIISTNTSDTLTVSEAWTATPDTTSEYSIEGGDTIDINKDDGQAVSGLIQFEEKIIIFKERSIWQMTFDEIGFPVVQMITGSYGCVSHRSIAIVENDIFYLSHDGVRSLGYVVNIAGVIRTNLVSIKIDSETSNVNSLQYKRAAGVYFEPERAYILSFPQGASETNNRMVVFQAAYNLWTLWTGLSANCFLKYIDEDTGQMGLFFGAEDSGYVHRMFSEERTDGGSTAIDAEFLTKQFDLNAFNLRKRFAFVDIQFRALQGTVKIEVFLDGSTTQSTKSVTLSSTFTAKDGLRVFLFREALFREDAGATASVVASDDVRRIKINKNARSIQVKVSNAVAGENFSMMGVSIGYRARSPFSFDSTKVLY